MSGHSRGPVSQAKLNYIFQKVPVLRDTPPPDGNVEVNETLGKGNFGYVYKGLVKQPSGEKKPSAVKVVFLKESELREIVLEVQILKECNHPNIVQYHGMFMKGLDLWICMELCGGGSIDAIYNRIPKPLTEESIAVILAESLKGLGYFHKTCHIHRDIKAGNILVTENGEVKLADFGVSAKLSMKQPLAHSFIGTPYWMAPEVIASEENRNNLYDSKVDIWSIGIVTIELADKSPPLSDIHPFTALKMIAQGKANLALKNPKKRSKVMTEFIEACLIRDPRKRPSAGDLLQHPFLQRVEKLKRQNMMMDLVSKSRAAKSGSGVAGSDSDEENDFDKYAPSADRPISDDEHNEGSTMNTAAQLTPAADSSTAEPLLYSTIDDLKAGSFQIEIKQNFTFEGDVLCGDFLFPYLLFGTDKGLLAVSIPEGAKSVAGRSAKYLIRNVRFRHLKVLEDYGVMVAGCGKNDHVRQYRLSSLKKLIKTRHGLANKTHQTEQVSTDMTSKLFHRSASSQNIEESADVLALLRDYVKIANTKDTVDFVIQRTAGSIFMLVLAKRGITLFEWAKEPYLRFMKVNDYWVPEVPKFMSLLHDGKFMKEIILGYAREANRIDVESSQVTEIEVHPSFLECPSSGKDNRWRTFDQRPIDSRLYSTIRATLRRTKDVHKKMAAAVSPYQAADGIDNKAQWRDATFIATFGKVTRIVDIQGKPVPNRVAFKWHGPPVSVMMFPENGVIVGVTNEMIEVLDLETGQLMVRLQQPTDQQLPLASATSVDTETADSHALSSDSRESVLLTPRRIADAGTPMLKLKKLCQRTGMLCIAASRRKKQSHVYVVSGVLPKPLPTLGEEGYSAAHPPQVQTVAVSDGAGDTPAVAPAAGPPMTRPPLPSPSDSRGSKSPSTPPPNRSPRFADVGRLSPAPGSPMQMGTPTTTNQVSTDGGIPPRQVVPPHQLAPPTVLYGHRPQNTAQQQGFIARPLPQRPYQHHATQAWSYGGPQPPQSQSYAREPPAPVGHSQPPHTQQHQAYQPVPAQTYIQHPALQQHPQPYLQPPSQHYHHNRGIAHFTARPVGIQPMYHQHQPNRPVMTTSMPSPVPSSPSPQYAAFLSGQQRRPGGHVQTPHPQQEQAGPERFVSQDGHSPRSVPSQSGAMHPPTMDPGGNYGHQNYRTR